VNVQLNLPAVDFVNEVETLVKDGSMTYMDAILHLCDKKKIEIEAITSLISNNSFVKAKLQLEAENLHFLPKSIKNAL
jgi:hypothetical protein